MKKNELSWDQFAGEAGRRHPLPEQWMMFVDGELSPEERAIAQQHLEACWRCRASVAEIEATIANISRYDQQVLQPRQTPPPTQQRMFQLKLQQLIEEQSAPAKSAGWRDWLTERLSLRWASACAAAVVLLLCAFWLIPSRPVSARELLERATQAETRRHRALSQPISRPVIHRQLQVRRMQGGQTQTARWELWQEAATQRGAERMPEDQALTEDLRALLQRNGIDASQPLSAASYRAWQQSIAQPNVTVAATTLASGAAAWSLTTNAPSAADAGALVRATLLVRAGDWQSTAQTYEFKTEPQNAIYELTETNYEIVELSQLDPTIFGATETAATLTSTPKLSPSIAPSVTPAPAASLAPVISAAQLLATELEALRLLNTIGADLGEEVSVKRTEQTLTIEATVENDARRQEILKALEPLARSAAVRLNLTTTAETLARQSQTPAAPRILDAESLAPVAQTMPMAEALRRHLQTRGLAATEFDEAVTQYAIRVVRRARQLNLHGWALRNLATRFSSEEIAALDAEAKAKRQALLQQQSRAWLRELNGLKQELAPFLHAAPPEAAIIPTITDEAALRQAITRLAQLTAALDAQIRAAFTVSTDASAPEIGTPQFRRQLAEAEALAAAIQNTARQ